MNQIKNKSALNLILFFSLFVILAAYFIEYVLGHKPCSLCFAERIPYLLSILLIILTMVLKKFEKITLILLSLLFIFGTLVSFYHFGIEQGLFSESFICNIIGNSENLSKEDLLEQIIQSPVS